jgi:hypothetical protein
MRSLSLEMWSYVKLCAQAVKISGLPERGLRQATFRLSVIENATIASYNRVLCYSCWNACRRQTLVGVVYAFIKYDL